jgi:glucose-1-phosphate adenylyltransferase
MAPAPKVLAIILAGGEGSRLLPLTRERSKPSVPFGGRYRIVDFVLSNFVNSQIYSIYLLVQYKSQSLIEHVHRAWGLSPIIFGHFITVVPPQMREGPEWFQGTSDAVYQNLNLVHKHRPDLVAVFGADHIYRMDMRQMITFHQDVGADVTVAAIPVPISQTPSFGIIAIDHESRITEFQEKPACGKTIPGDPQRALASMGNYIFSRDVLIEALEEAKRRGEKDFGKHVLPRLIGERNIYAYDFGGNRVPGVKPYEEGQYWRDVGTIAAFWEAHQDLIGAAPKFDLFNPLWPIHSSPYSGPNTTVIGGEVINSNLGDGTVMYGGKVRNSVIRREVVIEEDVEIDGCVVMDYVMIKRGSRLRNAIVDRRNIIEPGTVIGFDRKADAERYYVDETSGITVVAKGHRRLELVY